MNRTEKWCTVVTVLAPLAVLAILFKIPEARAPLMLFPLAVVGVSCNALLLYLVFKDIFTRPFARETQRYFWAAAIFLCFPMILPYLIMHGFKPRSLPEPFGEPKT